MPNESREDEDDTFIENFNCILLFILAILSASVSVIVLVYLATAAVYSQQLPVDFLYRSSIAALLLVIGFSSLHLFRKKRETRKRKQSGWFMRTKA